jgi:hypothetical protein
LDNASDSNRRLGAQSPQIESIGALTFLVEHDLFGKTGIHPRLKTEGRLFADHA